MNDRKNIAVFSLAYEPLVGGAEIALKEIITRLPEFDFYVFTNKFKPEHLSFEQINNIRIIRLGNGRGLNIFNKILFPFLAAREFKKENKDKHFLLQWAMMATYAGLAGLLVKYRFPSTPYLLTDQSGDSEWFLFKRTWWWRYFYKQIYRRADCVQVISKWLEKRARSYGAGIKNKIELVPNGVSVNKFSNLHLSSEEKLKIKTDYGFAADDRIVISPSRLVEKNGLYYLISTAARLPGKYKIVIVGDGKLQYKLRQHALGLGISDRVIFLNSVNHDELTKLLSISFAMCRPSLTEGFGNVFVEAMAAGVPVVGTNVGGIPDIIINNENGLLVSRKNPIELGNALLSLEDDNLREKLIANGLKTALSYDWDGVSEKIKIIFESLINNK